ncbi:uncharacterized protein LOC100680302 [Nasonia vitripennis]|uniref:Copper homeostasis protein cutC homolog n=1 Tax=Nasonia vitripennis TaxID=7425 RepID=A0A7M7IPX7_NASVI|nr:uncharacterized protein LOC100680302 [Nasonia vitripennis]XP_032454871.1 uncharacterized protein LOC100680302 [Nasonia vitripennis]
MIETSFQFDLATMWSSESEKETFQNESLDIEDVKSVDTSFQQDQEINEDDSLPGKSRSKYYAAYNIFSNWLKENEATISEETMLVYFDKYMKKYKPSSVWAHYSMIKTMIKVRENIDISTYKVLLNQLKINSSGYRSKKSEVFSGEQIKKFLEEAPDEIHLANKVVIIFGTMGYCRGEELTQMKMKHITEEGQLLVVDLPPDITYKPRQFTINADMSEIVKKYMKLRFQNASTDRFFLTYRHGKLTNQPIGKNKFGCIPRQIATWLKLKNADLYTGHALRRTSSKLLSNAGGIMINLKHLGGWKYHRVNQGSGDNSLNLRTRMPEVEEVFIKEEFEDDENDSFINAPDINSLIIDYGPKKTKETEEIRLSPCLKRHQTTENLFPSSSPKRQKMTEKFLPSLSPKRQETSCSKESSSKNFEVCVDSYGSIKNAVEGGADRLELCSALSEGGLTPSFGLAKLAKKIATIPVFAMLRIRGGNFIYDPDEIDAMLEDLQVLKSLGIDGFVFGALKSSSELDTDACKRVVAAAYPLPVTFHRAFDEMTNGPLDTLDTIIDLGFKRLLTSGREKSAAEGVYLLGDLVERAGDRLVIMPGAGITAENIACVCRGTKAKEFHGSAKRPTKAKDDDVEVKIERDNGVPVTDAITVSRIKKILKECWEREKPV